MNNFKTKVFESADKVAHIASKMGITKKTPGALKIYNFFYGLFWPYEKILEIQGSKMYFNAKDESLSMRQTFSSYAAAMIHEKTTTELFNKILKPGDTMVDLGANIGYFSMLSAKLVGKNGKVYSFEPEPKNFSYLKKNIELNNYTQVFAFQKAVSDKAGTTKLFICSYDTGHHTINKVDGIDAYSRGRVIEKQDVIEIETVKLDDIFAGKENTITLIKMDVEGAEALALSGMDNILRTNQKIKMVIEFFPLLIKKMGSSPEDFVNKLLNVYKFKVSIIPDDYAAENSNEMIPVNHVSDVMKRIKLEDDHVNLFVRR